MTGASHMLLVITSQHEILEYQAVYTFLIKPIAIDKEPEPCRVQHLYIIIVG